MSITLKRRNILMVCNQWLLVFVTWVIRCCKLTSIEFRLDGSTILQIMVALTKKWLPWAIRYPNCHSLRTLSIYYTNLKHALTVQYPMLREGCFVLLVLIDVGRSAIRELGHSADESCRESSWKFQVCKFSCVVIKSLNHPIEHPNHIKLCIINETKCTQ